MNCKSRKVNGMRERFLQQKPISLGAGNLIQKCQQYLDNYITGHLREKSGWIDSKDASGAEEGCYGGRGRE